MSEQSSNEKVKKNIRCFVVSDKMNKTRVGRIERLVKHPMLGKYLKKSTRIKFHDEKNETNLGDEVFVTECKPISADKTFVYVSLINKAKE